MILLRASTFLPLKFPIELDKLYSLWQKWSVSFTLSDISLLLLFLYMVLMMVQHMDKKDCCFVNIIHFFLLFLCKIFQQFVKPTHDISSRDLGGMIDKVLLNLKLIWGIRDTYLN